MKLFRVKSTTKALLETDDANRARECLEKKSGDGRYRNLVMEGYNSMTGRYVVVASANEPAKARGHYSHHRKLIDCRL